MTPFKLDHFASTSRPAFSAAREVGSLKVWLGKTGMRGDGTGLEVRRGKIGHCVTHKTANQTRGWSMSLTGRAAEIADAKLMALNRFRRKTSPSAGRALPFEMEVGKNEWPAALNLCVPSCFPGCQGCQRAMVRVPTAGVCKHAGLFWDGRFTGPMVQWFIFKCGNGKKLEVFQPAVRSTVAKEPFSALPDPAA